MKALIGSGLCLALGLMTARSFAQEIQWRPKAGAAPTAAASAAPVTLGQANPITPASYTVTQPANPGVSLDRPLNAGGAPAFRPVGIYARGKADDPPAQLPLGGGVTIEVGKPEAGQPGGKTEGGKQETGKPEKLSPPPIKMVPKSEFIPGMPAIVNSEYGPVSGACVCDSSQCHDAAGCDPCCTTQGDCGSCAVMSRHGFRRVRPMSMGTTTILEDCVCPTTSCSMSDCCVESCPTCLDCGPCDEGCPWDCRIYGNASFLLWNFRQKNLPPLVTSSPAGTPAAQVGVLGLPTTTILFDQGNQESRWHMGGRFNVGFWLPGGGWGFEAGYMFLARNNTLSTFASTDATLVARPIIVGGNEAQVGAPTVTVNMFSRLWGFEANLRHKLLCCQNGWVDAIVGYRHLDFDEGLSITETVALPGPLNLHLIDQFNTRNIFDGGQVGLQGEYHFMGNFFLGGSLKVAVGNMHQTVNVQGTTTFATNFMAPVVRPGALLALNSNIGNRSQDRFAVIPELGVKLGYEITPNWRAWVGYDFLFISSVVRPGDQIDRRIEPTRLPNLFANGATNGPVLPAPQFNPVSFWAQGASLGMEYRW